MEEEKFFIDGDVITYIKIPVEMAEETLTVQLEVPRELQGKYLKIIAVSDDISDIPVKSLCTGSECENCHVQNCGVHYGNAILYDCELKEKHDIKPNIPGHPNCHYGDCYDCHVVSCGIQQGWAPIPGEEDDK